MGFQYKQIQKQPLVYQNSFLFKALHKKKRFQIPIKKQFIKKNGRNVNIY